MITEYISQQDAKNLFRHLMKEEWGLLMRQQVNNIRLGTIISYSVNSRTARVQLDGSGETTSSLKYPKDTLDINMGDRAMVISPDPKVKSQNYIVGIY